MLKMLMMVQGYPVGTYINASNKGAPYNLPTTPWNTLKASAAKRNRTYHSEANWRWLSMGD